MPIIAAAGSLAGPCYETCDHLGCEHDRWITCQPCALCGNAIGFGYPYDIHEDASMSSAHVERLGYRPFVLVHRVCVERELQALKGDAAWGLTAERAAKLRVMHEMWRREYSRVATELITDRPLPVIGR
jgi:hypothetical protein